MGRRLARGVRRCGARRGLGHSHRRARYRHRRAGHCLRHRGAGHGLGHGRLPDHGLRAAGDGLDRARHRHCWPRNGHGFSRAGHDRCTSWSEHDRPGHASHSIWRRPPWPWHGFRLRDRRLRRLAARGAGGRPDRIVEPVANQALREDSQRRHGKQVRAYTRQRLPPTIRLKRMSPRAATISAVFCSWSNTSA
jgi:hypothetical protein